MWRHHSDNSTPQAWQDLRAEMLKAIERAHAHGVDLGMEPELANVINSAAAARRLIDEVASPRLRIVLDCANLFEVRAEPEGRALIEHSIDILADRISIAHAKDRAARGAFVAAGSGVIDFPHFIGGLRASGWLAAIAADGPGVSEPDVQRIHVPTLVIGKGSIAFIRWHWQVNWPPQSPIHALLKSRRNPLISQSFARPWPIS